MTKQRKTETSAVKVIGAGLAGCEAAWQLARRGISVELYEMKPHKKTPAHTHDGMAELVCSNSLRSGDLTCGVGLLKEEMRRIGSLIMEAADATKVSAGGALAVDREEFSAYITDKISADSEIRVIHGEVTSIPDDGICIVATGPLTSDAMAESVSDFVGGKKLSFYDAAAPIVEFSSIDMSKAFFASRYDRGTPDYINCPMNESEYRAFYNALKNAECAHLHDFEQDGGLQVFEGCMPVEVMAERGEDTLRFGPMKPVGIHNPETGESYYAVVQLRRENEEGTMFNIVGFQTHLTFPEQRRVFGMIPGLENASFFRYGVMHRNTFINSPGILGEDFSAISRPELYFAGQMTGVEGYIESAASGMVAGISAARRALGLAPVRFPDTTMTGAMCRFVSMGTEGDFQPMNANFGLIARPDKKIRGGKRARREYYAARALETLDGILANGI